MTLPDWPRAGGEPPVTALLRLAPGDFEVEEVLGFEPEGEGEHLWLWVQKCERNSADVARALARFAGVRVRDIGMAGLKDRRAVARQWFSLQLPRVADSAWSAFSEPGIDILHLTRHRRKLRRGAHRGNRFCLLLRELSGDVAALETRLGEVAASGVPNYFGEQRFGRGGANIEAALDWLEAGCPRIARERRSLWLSVARSLLFNEVLARRVRDRSWNRILPGELMQLAGSASVFAADAEQEKKLAERLESGDVNPTGPLPGRGAGLAPEAEVASLEAEVLEARAGVTAALAAAGVDASRRSLRLLPTKMEWSLETDATLRLAFELPRGCFATAVVRELARFPAPESVCGHRERSGDV